MIVADTLIGVSDNKEVMKRAKYEEVNSLFIMRSEGM